MRTAAIITAAGSGSRMGIEQNKVLLPLDDGTVIKKAVQAFANTQKIQKIVITHSPEDREALVKALSGIKVPVSFVRGGSTRQKSVFNGLKELVGDNPRTVLIHDAARPWISGDLIEKVINQADETGSSVPVTASVNAMKKIDEAGKIIEHLERNKTVSAQTPQGFHFLKILDAHKRADNEAFESIDDTELWDRYFDRVSTVPGEIGNIKITYREDLEKV